MFDDARETAADRMALVVTDIEEWLADHDYDVVESVRTGEFSWDEPGYAVGAENDAITIGYLAEEGDEPVLHTYALDELWGMDEDEFRSEVDELAEEAVIASGRL